MILLAVSDKVIGLAGELIEQVYRVKNFWGCQHLHSNYLDVSSRFGRTLAEDITLGEAVAPEF